MANGLIVGSDYTVDFTDAATGSLVGATILTGFSKKQITADISSVAMTGDVRYDHLPKGWDLSFEFDQGNSVLDDFFASGEAAYFNGGRTAIVTVTETITYDSGAVAQYQFTGVSLKLENGGDAKGDGLVKQTVSGKASRRIKLS